jgi:hypothetical protein
MLLDPVTLFRLIDARSTSSWDLERWKKGGGRERSLPELSRKCKTACRISRWRIKCSFVGSYFTF